MIAGNKLGDKGTIIVCENLKENITLKTLKLSIDLTRIIGANKIGEIGIKAIAEGFSDDNAIQYINLSIIQIKIGYNIIKHEEAKSISRLMNNCKFLKKLDLSYNDIGDKGIKEMLTELKENRFITELNLCIIFNIYSK